MGILELLDKIVGALPGACSQGLIWGIMAIGLYITYRILDIADLSVDGSFATGGAICVMALLKGCNVWVALLLAFLSGLLAGAVTGLLHTLMGIPRHSRRYTHPARSLFRQPQNSRQIQPIDKRQPDRPAHLPALGQAGSSRQSAYHGEPDNRGSYYHSLLVLRH